MLNESALQWIGDEIRATLRELSNQLHSLLQVPSTERAALLSSCQDKLRSVSGALNVANCEPLALYANTIQNVIQLWRDSPSSMLPATVTTAAMASQSLDDFLQAAQEKKSLSELALFDDYQRLGSALSKTVSPVDLWPTSESAKCYDIWLQAELLDQLVRTAQERLSQIDIHFLEQLQIDVLMLALIRQQNSEAALALQSYCDLRGLQSGPSKHTVVAALLSQVITSVSQGQLLLDPYVKRYLLASLVWLKGKAELETIEHETVFFAYLAWQAQQEHPVLAVDQTQVLDRFATAAMWQAQKGTHYSEAFFDPHVRELLLKAQAASTATKQMWSDFCNVPTTGSPTIKTSDLTLSFDKMGQSLEALHPAAAQLSQAFYAVVSDSQLCARRDVQVEIATLLLVLSSMLGDMKGRDRATIEQQFMDLANRLDRLRAGQKLGSYEPWMLQLQQRQDWVQAMTSTTEVLGQKLTEIEGMFERYWAHPNNLEGLAQVPSQLQQISAIARSLKLDDFANAALPFEAKVKALIQAPGAMDEASQKQIAADLAGLGLMLSMWAHKPEMAYSPTASPAPEPLLDIEPSFTASPVSSAVAEPLQEHEESIERVFLMEAHDVLVQADTGLVQLTSQPEHTETLIAVRRAFHTLKGGARVVGLADFGEAAWLMEQYLNDKLAQQQTLSANALALCREQVQRMQGWTQQLQSSLAEQPAAQSLAIETSGIDWQLGALQQALQALEPQQAASLAAPLALDLPPTDFLDLPTGIDDADDDTQIKTIGDLQISIPLYQAFLNETDEWSRQLALALSEWALDEGQLFPDQTVGWAHALAGSSATVGFDSCAQLAKLSETLLTRAQAQGIYSVDLAQTLSDAAEEMRRLLHQFAAGFLKTADSALLDKLQSYLKGTPELTEPPVEPVLASETAAAISPTLAPIQSAPFILAPAVDAEVKAIFEEESAQLIPQLGSALRTWDKAEALRTLHTLKGSARLVGEQTLAERAHDLESLIEQISGEINAQQHAELLQAYDQMVASTAVSAVSVDSAPTASQTAQVSLQPMPAQPFVAVTSGETIRVQSHTVDRLVNQTGELMIARSRMEAEMARSLRTLSDMGLQVQRLRDQLREMELQTESQMQSRQAQVSDAANSFDPLELDRFTRTQELTRFMAEALSDVATLQRSLQRSLNTTEDDLAAQLRQTRDLQRNLLRTRMVEFDSVGERLHRLVRMTSAELGKSIELLIQNGAQEMDRSVLGRMLPVFEHLLRNAVVHGIELSPEREAKGKNAQGQITIQLSQQSNDVIVSLQDDGRGIDQQALLDKARARSGDANFNADPAELIFMSGLSTAPEVSELAGRGIGMDVVRSQVFALGGRIEVGTTEGVGTSFKLILPLTTAVTQVVLVRTGSLQTGIPGNLVSSILRVKPEDILSAHDKKYFVHGEQNYPFFGFSHLLQYTTPRTVFDQPTQSVILLQSAGQTIALHVDEVLGNQEVMVKNLGIQLAQMPGLSGMTVLPTGPTVLIYNPVALAAIYGPLLGNDVVESSAERQETQNIELPASTASLEPLVLVVDDSITMRRVLQRLLQREGYRVAVAADGRQALDTLRLERPALVLSDVEMPRMDGFELLRSIRVSDRLADLPVVMITSRIADKHREHAKDLGANEYLGKPYSEDELLQILERYAAKASAPQATV